MNIIIILQGRVSSSRLPGKILMPILDRPMIAFGIDRLRQARLATELVVATTRNPEDDLVEALCKSMDVRCYRGSEHDVLSRYYEAACWRNADAVVRVTGDCPLLDPVVVNKVIQAFCHNSQPYDYVSNTLERTYPRGMDVEIFSMEALTSAYHEARQEVEREHVTPFIYWHPERFRIGQVKGETDLSEHRWTVDTAEDFELIRRILEALYPTNPLFTLQDVAKLLTEHPDWSKINAHIEQKSVLTA